MEPQQKQSRLGKQPVPVPKGVKVTVGDQSVTVKGPKGELTRSVHATISVEQKGDNLIVAPRPGTGRQGTQFQGLVRALLNNALKGVNEGYKTSLDLYGVGYRAEVKGQELHLNLGLSHPVHFTLPTVVKAKVETIDQGGIKRPRLHLESHDNEVLGQVAARVKSFRPPEPYKGKGVRFTGEQIRVKAGKAGAK